MKYKWQTPCHEGVFYHISQCGQCLVTSWISLCLIGGMNLLNWIFNSLLASKLFHAINKPFVTIATMYDTMSKWKVTISTVRTCVCLWNRCKKYFVSLVCVFLHVLTLFSIHVLNQRLKHINHLIKILSLWKMPWISIF